jgi:hypothetical protein
MLRFAGFLIVTLHDEYGDDESKIADPVMIRDCGLKGRTLLTGDQDLLSTWFREIVDAHIAVFVTTNNNEAPKQWGPRIAKAKEDILRELKRRNKPFAARISANGRITQVKIPTEIIGKQLLSVKKIHRTRTSTSQDNLSYPQAYLRMYAVGCRAALH